ncbi:hypothetical protein D3C78_1832890 [compost metagenome]
MTVIAVLSVLGGFYIVFGIYSLVYYICEFVISEVKENKFYFDMAIVMLTALFLPPVYWFLRYAVKNLKIM